MNWIQVLSDVWIFYKQQFWRLLLYIVPVSAVLSSLSLWGAAALGGGDEMTQVRYLLLFNFILNPLYLAGLIFLLSRLLDKQFPRFGEILRFALDKWLPLLTVSLLYALLTALGLFLFILPGIWIFMRLILSAFLVVLDKQPVIDALNESFHLTQGEFWNITGTTLLIFLSLVFIQQYILILLPENGFSAVLVSVIGDCLWAVLTITWFRFYDYLKHGH